MEKTDFFGVGVCRLDGATLVDYIISTAQSHVKAVVNNVNVRAMNLASEDSGFARALDESDVVFCDGFGVKWAAAAAGIHGLERVTPPDWVGRLFRECEDKRITMYFLGDEQQVVESFVKKVKSEYPNLQVAGFHNGFFDPDGGENKKIVDELRKSGADIILTAMGMPRQEMWAYNNLPKLGRGVVVSTGALFRYYSGVEGRPPRWMCDHGLEWLGRLIKHPIRHFKRYVVGNTLFLARISYLLFFKRVFDAVSSLILLAATAPLSAAIFFLIKLDSPGPVLFTHDRVGKDGKTFTLYKFRTLRIDYPKYARKIGCANPYITRVGGILRWSGLDELPQAFNVLRGDMSLVGPRPEMPFIAEKYSGRERRRLAVKPGITGLWQIERLGGGLEGREIHEDLAFDMEYLRRQSFTLDAVIFVKTIVHLAKNLAKPYGE